MAIVGAHMLFYTPEAEALRTVLRETLGWDYVESNDPPDGWQIFKLPPAELGVHPSGGATTHQICLMCDDLGATITELRAKGIEFRGEAETESFGITITMLLPGGVEVLLYEPTHRTAFDL
jgi:glyoxalase/bleomycin resistance protein/dioxygenase superfamily protein